jgi:hypothetical protein
MALRQHQRNDTRTRASIQNALTAFGPRSQQHTIGTYLHGAQLLLYRELFKLKHAAKIHNYSQTAK